MHELNEDGCLECFCFGKSDQCHFSQYPATEISDMEDWSLIGLKTKRPSIFFDRDEQKLTMVLSDSERRRKKPLYWGAPLVSDFLDIIFHRLERIVYFKATYEVYS